MLREIQGKEGDGLNLKTPRKEREYTPTELFGKELSPQEARVAELNDGKEERKKVSDSKMMTRGGLLAVAAILLIMALCFGISAMQTAPGSFKVKTIGPMTDTRLLSLSETAGFANPTVHLSAIPIPAMDNITYSWLPLDEMEARDGSHNGDNYIAYTFYLRNSGSEPLDYKASLVVNKRTRGVEEAVRVMLYRNGEPTIYAMPTAYGQVEPYPEAIVNFLSADLVTEEVREALQPGEYDRYTVVVWLEGEDPQCVDAVLGGNMGMEMQFALVGEEEPTE